MPAGGDPFGVGLVTSSHWNKGPSHPAPSNSRSSRHTLALRRGSCREPVSLATANFTRMEKFPAFRPRSSGHYELRSVPHSGSPDVSVHSEVTVFPAPAGVQTADRAPTACARGSTVGKPAGERPRKAIDLEPALAIDNCAALTESAVRAAARDRGVPGEIRSTPRLCQQHSQVRSTRPDSGRKMAEDPKNRMKIGLPGSLCHRHLRNRENQRFAYPLELQRSLHAPFRILT